MLEKYYISIMNKIYNVNKHNGKKIFNINPHITKTQAISELYDI